MCLARAYLTADGEDEVVLEDVALVEIDGTRVHLSTLFGEEREIDGAIKAVDFQNGRLVVETRPG
jgi:predicted RNA-binding protein